MRSVLVTGSNGLLGNKVVSALLNEGYNVIGVAIDETAKCHHERFKYISADLTNSVITETIFKEYKFSHVIHLAAIAHSIKGIKIPWSKYYRVNTMMSRQVFDCASKDKTPIFFASTVDVYGIQDKTISEESEPHPIGSYAKSKIMAERSLTELAKQPYLIARFAPIYTDENYQDRHKRYYIRYPKLSYLIGDGMEYEFLSSENAVNLILKWVESPETINGILNVCDDKRYNTKELIKKDKKNGLANKVFWIPKWLKKIIHISVDIVFCKMPFLRFTAYKIICPMRFEHSRLKELLQVK